MRICVVGLGYVGTVSAACLACRGHTVWGVDINLDKIHIINRGDSPIVENGLASKISKARSAARLHATADIKEALRESEVCFIAVATPSRANGEIDTSHLLRAYEQIADTLVALGRSQIVVVRSSVLPSAFEQCKEAGDRIAPGKITLCANPEFLREGTAIHDFENPPFTLLGVDNSAGELALSALYEGFVSPIYVLPPREALLVKYASNAYHALKVTFANEIGTLCQSAAIDGRAVMQMFCRDRHLNISEKYLSPGFAFGGSCLPKDLRAILQMAKRADIELPLMSSLFASNAKTIERAVRRVLSVGAHRIGMIGLSFKPNTDDLRESPYVELAERLIGKGHEMKIYDPNVSLARLTGANRDYINKAIPHLSRLLVPSLSDLEDSEVVIVGHSYAEVSDFIERPTCPSLIDLTGQYSQTSARQEESWNLSATF
ncbi:MAG TPA: nucleotide sugar dehydrogenase [Candidatus Aquilonibacter sp.]|nr:nucleotide sugar dehydrogenase [Candidatus Aquilonibacter sp.]